jgi:glycosyltransferase involved in cell wall biosynthesis
MSLLGRAMTRAPDKRAAFPQLVILTPVFNEEESLPQYVKEVSAVLLDRSDVRARVLFVDDGSSDGSWDLIEEICRRDTRFQGLRLSRNFGAHAAIAAGLSNLPDDVDVVAIVACDLQDPPSTVLGFVESWRKGSDIVWGERIARQDSRWRVTSSHVFESVLRRWAMPPGSLFTTGSFLLADRRVVEAVRQMPERNPITFALVAWTGFDQSRVQYQRRERVAGHSGWTLRRMIKAMYDAFVGFSALPIRLMKIAGFSASFCAVAVAIYLVVSRVAHTTAPGWLSEMLLLSVFFAIQFTLTALTGEYLARIHSEVVRRPLFFVSETTQEALESP